MTRREIVITRFLRSRGCGFLVGACAMGFAAATYVSDPSAPLSPVDYGVAFPSANCWLPSLWMSTGAAWLVNLAIAAFLILINRSINLLRTVSVTYASLFLLMQSVTPPLTGRLCDGVLLGLVIMTAMGLLYSCYQEPSRTPRVFLAFFLAGSGIMWRYSYALFLPALLLGVWQMKIFSFRSLVAALLGLASPLWIAIGSGITNPLEWPLPEFSFDSFRLLEDIHVRHSLLVAAVTLVAAVIFSMSDIFKILSYNAATRAYNSLLMTMTLTVGIAVIADWTNLSLYLTLLNAMTAFQTGHFLKINGSRRAYIPVGGLILLYFSFYLWNLWILI